LLLLTVEHWLLEGCNSQAITKQQAVKFFIDGAQNLLGLWLPNRAVAKGIFTQGEC